MRWQLPRLDPDRRRRIRQTAKRAAQKSAAGCLRDLAGLAGAAAIVYGVGQWSGPAAWITAGLALVALAIAASRAAAAEQRRSSRKGTE